MPQSHPHPQPMVTRDGPRDRLRGAPSPAATEDRQPPTPPSEKLVASVAESASALSLQEPDVSSSGVEPDVSSSDVWLDTSDESSSDSDDSDDDSPSSKILYRRRPRWYQVYFIRTDRSGQFRMYPDLGGPFQSLDQVDSAITQQLAKLEQPFKEKDNYSIVDKIIHEHKYCLDGTPKRGPNSRRKTNPDEDERHLVQALLDQYNEDNNLFGNLVHDLDSLLRHEWLHEKNRWYIHFNFTTKTGNLFFAEVSHRQGERGAWKVNCCCIIDSNENGQCKGCRNNGSPDMKHPNNTDAYVAGRLDGYLPFGEGEQTYLDDLEAEAARLRVVYEGLDDPDAMERLRLRAMRAFNKQ
ncbi:unnamed protein product [Urochloa decumbens]|uniref:DUF3615 domain-containing protein n=1 Tax=Urochloa decumbens TaxID=240449 RepID=A0ABC9E4E8_9POAL